MKVKKSLNKVSGLVCLMFFLLVYVLAWAQDPKARKYVGCEACRDCHRTEYENFHTYAKKAHSYGSIKVMKKGLTEAEFSKCFECHTTGYNKPGGFRSEQETPHLKDAGCEVCHGPGSLHVETGEPGDIKRHMTAKDCEVCHNEERVGAFHYKPLIHGGAH
jgi:hypothetical protein